jgi:hypothetical protein
MSSLGRRVAAVGSGLVDTFLRDNKVLPVVLALLALLVFAWVAAGLFLSAPENERVSNRANVAQSENTGGSNTAAPEAENRGVNSYAAYQSKDPFRQIIAPAETTTAATTATTTQTTTATIPETTAQEITGGETTSAGGGATGPRGGGRKHAGGNRGGGSKNTGGLFNSGGNLPVP